MNKKDLWLISIAFLIIISVLIGANNYVFDIAREHIIRDARTVFNMDIAIRHWATSYGGVYVPVDKRTKPNPYLINIPERDLKTPSGRELTLMNPAYILRQLNEDFKKEFGVSGHITSLKPIRPENKPDDWETKALNKFEKGEKEYYEFLTDDNNKILRLMRPLVVEKGCLKCHKSQGYKEGDIRGGISVTLPATKEFKIAIKNYFLFSILFVFLCVIVIAIYFWSQSKIRSYVSNLQVSEEKYRLLFNNMMTGFSLQEIIYDSSGIPVDIRVIEANEYVKNHTGLSPEDLKGKTLSELFPQIDTFNFDNIRGILENGVPFKEEIYFEPIGKYLEVFMYIPQKDQLASVFMDITKRKMAENELKASLNEKTILLKEIHHRVKNNMQIMSSLLHLQKANSKNKEVLDIINDSCSRITSMALVHQLLYQSDSFASINLDDYIKNLVQKLLIHFRDIAGYISLDTEVEDITFDINIMIPLGLILNELITNSIKYAFSGISDGKITIKVKKEGEQFVMLYSDNGVGMPANIDFENVNTLGMTLIKNLSDQIDGKAEMIPGEGSVFRIYFNGKYN